MQEIYYVKEALNAYLDMHEKELNSIAAYEDQIKKGVLKPYSLVEIKNRHALD